VGGPFPSPHHKRGQLTHGSLGPYGSRVLSLCVNLRSFIEPFFLQSSNVGASETVRFRVSITPPPPPASPASRPFPTTGSCVCTAPTPPPGRRDPIAPCPQHTPSTGLSAPRCPRTHPGGRLASPWAAAWWGRSSAPRGPSRRCWPGASPTPSASVGLRLGSIGKASQDCSVVATTHHRSVSPCSPGELFPRSPRRLTPTHRGCNLFPSFVFCTNHFARIPKFCSQPRV